MGRLAGAVIAALQGPNSKSFSNVYGNVPLTFPRPISLWRFQQGIGATQDEEIEECALADVTEATEFVTFDSGKLGAFTKKERLEMVRLTLAELESWNKNLNTVVYENMYMYCIYRFTHMDRSSEKEITQITVGSVVKNQSCPETGEELYDLIYLSSERSKGSI